MDRYTFVDNTKASYWRNDNGLKLAYKIFERLRELGVQCKIVKFSYEEKL